MKKNVTAILMVAVFVLLSTTCFAMEFGIKGGVHDPTGNYGDIVDTGFTIGGHFKAYLADNLALGVHLAYANADGDHRYAFGKVSHDVTMIEIYPFVDLYPVRTDRFGIFLRGGLGVNFWEIEVKSGSARYKQDDSDLMVALGAGMNFFRNFEAVALYNRIYDGDDDINYYTLTLGYNFNWTR